MFGKRGGTEHSGLILKDMEVRGTITFKDVVTVEGKIVGTITSETGHLIVNKDGRVEGDVFVGMASIGGEIIGDVHAQTRIDIHETGRVTGNVRAPVLTVDAGANINGKVETIVPSSKPTLVKNESENPTELRAIG